MSINNTARRHGDEIALRYSILSKKMCGEALAKAVRNHWGVESSLHWQLDVTFSEDQCRIRKGRGHKNFSALRRTVLSLLKKETLARGGIENKRLTAGWDDNCLEKISFW
jgi:predicted transposase YbfD/YdcC